jgi:hypothetical protein
MRSHIHGRILFIFAVNILQVTSSSMGYVLFMFMHRTVRMHAWFRVRSSLDGFSSNMLGIYYKWPQVTCARYLTFSYTARMRASACVRARAWLSVCLSMDGFSLNLWWAYYKSHQVAWATYFPCSGTARMRVSARARMRVRAWFSVRLSLDGVSSNLLGTYYKSPQVAWATYLSWRVCVIACPNSTHQYRFANSDTYDT